MLETLIYSGLKKRKHIFVGCMIISSYWQSIFELMPPINCADCACCARSVRSD